MSLIKKCCLGFLILLLLLIGSVAFLLGTTSGLHMVINATTRWVPGLEIAAVSGGWRDLTLKGVKYQMPGVSVNAGQFHLSLELSCLRHSTLCINALTAQDVDVLVKTAQITPSEQVAEESAPLTNLSTPYPITLRKLALNNVKVNVDDTAISLGEFSSGAHWQQRALTLMPTTIRALLVALPKAPVNPLPEALRPHPSVNKTPLKQPAAEEPLGETLKALFAKPLLPQLPNIHLPLDVTIEEISGDQLHLTGDTELAITRLLLQASNKEQDIQVDRFEVMSPQGSLFTQGQATLAGDWPMAMTANGTLNIDPLKGEKVKLNMAGGLRSELNVGLNLSGPVSAQLDVQTQLAEAGLPLLLTLQSKQLKWPLAGEAQYQINDLRLRFNGNASDYALSTRADIRGQELPPAVLTLDGKGNLEQFRLERLRLAALEGNTDLTALVDWSKAISWTSQLTLSGINTAKQWPEWPARLEGKITTRGSLNGGSWQLQVPTLQLDGNVKQNKVSARGSLSGNAAGQWAIPGIDLALGRNILSVKGQLDEKNWALDATVNAPRLDGALPGLAGNVRGLLKLRGSLLAPQLLTDLTASGLQWQALHINRVKIDGDVRSSDQIQGQLSLRIEQLKQDALQVGLLTLDARGSERQHRLQLNIEGKPVSGRLALEGSFDRLQQRWRGNLNNTRFDTPVGEWRLTRSIALDYLNTQQRISIGAHCWANPDAELCVPNTINVGASGQASVVLNRFDLAMLKPFLGPETAMSGIFSGRADVSWRPDGTLPQARVSLVGNGVKVVQQVQGSALPIAFDTLNLNAGLNNGRAQADWLIKLTNNGQFNGNIQITDPQVRRAIRGNVKISNVSLALLNPILTQGEKATGMLNADLQLGGNARHPLVFGRLALDKVGIVGHWMPFDMTAGRLVLNFNGMTSTLEGLLATTHGQLNLAGAADWRDINAWRAHIAAKGERLRVTIPPMVRVDVSPDLRFEATPHLFSLNGSVDIPWARITVQQLPESAVGISPDEVMLNRQLQPIQPRSAGISINSNLTVRVGDDVRLDAFGLKARLLGNLRVLQDRNGLGLNGHIDIPSGRFHAYGQDLLVRKGQLLFSGPPDQPLLNIEAIRNPDATQDGVTAGVRVTGMADAPRLEVFSDPAMSQQAALSYLLRGQGLGSSGADGNAMTSMLIGMGVAQSGQLVGKIGEAFGVSNLALDTEGVGDSSQVVVSGYVLPGLQVKYGVGIFDSLATLTLRYRLMPRLYLEAVSGLNQALDVLYQFEF
ncbi:translocation/assembly module TamB domain-containing protein [Serratia sp. UGAL515B_01]|uniref:autotransporter assembly complex protein TamB n=1 Tax=Serratia sp. UGAL515B_01 TaxID=2986763 RepID=UPI002954604B|nr:translocation/assembly module TamB domain-containing protein [Serratia sp. UGAL515B_01]WON77300.1 translocation/assembly module TamB [Serratia sp. UGAL515B_01]